MDRLDAMSVLLAAVECGSLSKASRKLRQPLATVSRKVSELENYLNAALLVRSTKGLELTPASPFWFTRFFHRVGSRFSFLRAYSFACVIALFPAPKRR